MKYSDFKKMDFYHAFEDWLYSEISGDFYSPPLYSDDGDLLKDAEFDEDGCDRAVENTIKAAVLVYDQLDHDPIKLRNKSGDELLKMAGMDNDENISYVGLYCGLFLSGVADYPNFRGSLKGVIWRAFVEIVDNLFDQQDLLTWLQFYAHFNKYRTISLLPDKLKDENIMEYWNQLQRKGIVNDEYQIIYRKGVKNYHVALIANEFKWKANATWEDFEKHFLTRKKKPFKNLRAEYDVALRKNKDKVWKMIEECFK